MWRSARNGGLFLAPAFGLLLLANQVPTTVEELTANADLVADVTVSRLDVRVSLPDDSLSCFRALVTRRSKGASDPEITVCMTNVSEMNPPPPKLGRRYTMYLSRSPYGIYLPFSFAGFSPIKPGRHLVSPAAEKPD
jgi:hypothetical protein